ncbi:outer membrane beta-barrel protein [Halosquirtibacter laminarini]|uniref:Outer membrane beta-barrel protein n=1 Tax=Halosquirtibacter laminarini TaxID=3374600 RepID=A0AC61NPG4_9BACT|nr:outer membrane beta-barrel protein [Prolixibacteraceae bacterium]
MKRVVSMIFAMVCCIVLNAQISNKLITISGKIIDRSTKEPLAGASIVTDNGEVTISDTKGDFYLLVNNQTDTCNLNIFFMGYERKKVLFRMNGTNIESATIYMNREEIAIGEVEVKANIPIATQNGDTLIFSASSVKVHDNAKGINLIKKLPGFTYKNDKIETQGEQVKKIYVDGKPFFENDPKLALNVLPAEIIQNIQLFDDYGDVASFTGYANGNSVKAINIITKPGKRKKWIGLFDGGYGTDGRYMLENTLMSANKKHDLTLMCDNNNINSSRMDLSEFKSFEAKVSSQLGILGDEQSSLAGEQENKNRAVNYNLNLSDKSMLSLNYTSGRRNNELYQSNLQNYQDVLFYDIMDSIKSTTEIHKLNLKYTLEGKNDKLILSEDIFVMDGNVNSNSLISEYTNDLSLSNTLALVNATQDGLNTSTNAIWLHKFNDTGRSLTTIANIKLSSNETEQYINSSNKVNTKLKTNTDRYEELDKNENKALLRISYKEPLSIQGNLNIVASSTYGWSNSNTDVFLNNAGDYSHKNDLLSNNSKVNYLTNKTEVGYSSFGLKLMLNAGLSFEKTTLNKEKLFTSKPSVQEDKYNIFPMIFGKYFITSKKSLTFFVRGKSTIPSISQLQPTVDISNPQNVVIGNPDLEVGTQYMGVLRYTQTLSSKAIYLSAYASAKYTNGYISVENYFTEDDQIIYGTELAAGTNVLKPVNLDGYFNGVAGFDYAIPISLIRSNFTTGIKYAYSNIPTIFQGIKLDSKQHSTTLNLSLASNISNKIDFLVTNSTSYNHTLNSENSNSTKFIKNELNVEANFSFLNSWDAGFEVKSTSYDYFGEQNKENYSLVNLSVGKDFLKNKRAHIKLSVYDLFNQSQSISYNIHETYTEQINANSLPQYIMLTLGVKL